MTSPDSKPAANDPPAYQSPEITPDRRVILRYHHPTAAKVWCEAEWTNWQSVPLQKTSTGIWEHRSAPLDPAIYEYALFADTARVIDVQNPNVKNRFTSFAEVPGAEPAIYDIQPVPHGAVHIHWYQSPVAGASRRIHIYTPPGYETETAKRYPILYLLHGRGDDDEGWIRAGRANFILDNLLAAGAIRPMVVAMPHGHLSGTDWKENRLEKTRAFATDFLGNAMPAVESLYRVDPTRDRRAMAGLSMGGGQTLFTGMTHPDLFSAFGLFSSGLWPEITPALTEALPKLRAQTPNPLWIGIGRADFLFGHCEKLRALLDSSGVRYQYHEDATGHSWRTWRDYLARFAPLLFKEPTTPAPQPAQL